MTTSIISNIATINDVKLYTDGKGIYVSGNSYPIKDKMKGHGAKWDANKREWYFPTYNPDISHLLKEPSGYICCPFAYDMNHDLKIACCLVKCKKNLELEKEKEYKKLHEERVKKYHMDKSRQIENDKGKYIVIYYLRDYGETDEYGARFDTMEEADTEYERKIIYKGKRKYTPFDSKGTLWGINIVYNNKIVKEGYGKKLGDVYDSLYKEHVFKIFCNSK